MRNPTHDDLLQQHELLRSDPQKYLALIEEFIQRSPTEPNGYFRRHNAWDRLGRGDLALADLNRSLELEQHPITLKARGNLLRRRGRYQEAIRDFDQVEVLDPDLFVDSWGPLFRADWHARLGNEQAALADCARLADDHWTPGAFGAPAGTKQQVIAEIRQLAAAARMRSG
jgi:tetratricopeptide (TPR) repeat protein